MKILRVFSDIPTFRETSFEPTMNVVLADQARDSDEHGSTNGLGKTTFVRILHYCLGSDFSRETVLNHPELHGRVFGLDLEIGDSTVTVLRNTASPSMVTVTASFLTGRGIDVSEEEDGLARISAKNWRLILSGCIFPDSLQSGNHVDEPTYSPTFGQLIYYFMRLGKSAFVSPDESRRNMKGPEKRFLVSYLLGLNWSSQRNLSDQLDRQSKTRQLLPKKEEERERIGDSPTLGELEAERVQLETDVTSKQEEIDQFNVREDYRDLERRLQRVDNQIHSLINENFGDRRLLNYYQRSSLELPGADPTRPMEILRSAGTVFSKDSLKSIEDVGRFHAEVYRNRKAFLDTEIARLNAQIKERERWLDGLSDEKGNLLAVLKSSGAVDALVRLQRTHTDLVSRLEGVNARISERQRFDTQADQLKAVIARSKELLRDDLRDRRETADKARALFAKYTRQLYETPGRLVIETGAAGYRFDFQIDRKGSDGVDQMMVFCFDLVVASLWAERNTERPFLVHDSSLFADVDPRQVAFALKLAAEVSSDYGFQYITCLNVGALIEDAVPDLNPKELIEPFVRLRLTDDKPEGRLLGFALSQRDAKD